MTVALLYLLALLAVAVGGAAVAMILTGRAPIHVLRWHFLARKTLVWGLAGLVGLWAGWLSWQGGAFALWTLGPVSLSLLGVVLAHKLHPAAAFVAEDFPAEAEHPLALPLADDAEMALIEHGGVTRAYALDHLIHHHIINDRFGDTTVSITYCAMCRSIIPFDVTELGPLSVVALRDANMVVADRQTYTFFQQASFDSLVGPVHPRTLDMVPFQILPWSEVKQLEPMPRVAAVTEGDLRPFELPIPGVWQRVMAGDFTPSLSASRRDHTFPARTRVVGMLDPSVGPPRAWLKQELPERGVVEVAAGVFLVALHGVVSGYRLPRGAAGPLELTEDGVLCTSGAATRWDLRGRRLSGDLPDLDRVRLSDEYWFSWRLFHPQAALVRL